MRFFLQIVSGKHKRATSVLPLLIGAAVAFASHRRGSLRFIVGAVKERILSGVQPFDDHPSHTQGCTFCTYTQTVCNWLGRKGTIIYIVDFLRGREGAFLFWWRTSFERRGERKREEEERERERLLGHLLHSFRLHGWPFCILPLCVWLPVKAISANFQFRASLCMFFFFFKLLFWFFVVVWFWFFVVVWSMMTKCYGCCLLSIQWLLIIQFYLLGLGLYPCKTEILKNFCSLASFSLEI